jgi:hypothetical protein
MDRVTKFEITFCFPIVLETDLIHPILSQEIERIPLEIVLGQ